MTQTTTHDPLTPEQQDALAELARTSDEELLAEALRSGEDVEALVADMQDSIHARLIRCVEELRRGGIEPPDSLLDVLAAGPRRRSSSPLGGGQRQGGNEPTGS